MINTNDDIEYDISDGLQAIFDAVNRNGGFNVMGWTRRGRINDQSQEGERDKASVNSSEVSHYIVKIGINNGIVPLTKALKIDVHGILRQAHVSF